MWIIGSWSGLMPTECKWIYSTTTALMSHSIQSGKSSCMNINFWGQNDFIFTSEGGEAYLEDIPDAEIHRLESGHFAVEDCIEEIVADMKSFYLEKMAQG